jgi:asparagine synthetase B (glutamine-hydrolysing)
MFECRMPLMDADVVEFLLTIPPSARIEQRIYKRMIAYAFPRVRDIPCTNSARPINPNFGREYVAMVLRYLGRKALGPLTRRKPPLGRAPRDVAQHFRAEPALMDEVLRPLVRDGCLPDDLFDPKGIEAVIDEHYKGEARHEALLSALISFGLGVKYLLRDDFSDVDPRYRGE